MMLLRFFICLTLLSACQQDAVPEGILPLAQMTPLVEEITLLETHYQSKFGVPGQYKAALDLSVQRVFTKAGCTQATFKKSLTYYAAHPDLQNELNERLLTSLSRKLR